MMDSDNWLFLPRKWRKTLIVTTGWVRAATMEFFSYVHSYCITADWKVWSYRGSMPCVWQRSRYPPFPLPGFKFSFQNSSVIKHSIFKFFDVFVITHNVFIGLPPVTNLKGCFDLIYHQNVRESSKSWPLTGSHKSLDFIEIFNQR
jgi:hypothetical protein